MNSFFPLVWELMKGKWDPLVNLFLKRPSTDVVTSKQHRSQAEALSSRSGRWEGGGWVSEGGLCQTHVTVKWGDVCLWCWAWNHRKNRTFEKQGINESFVSSKPLMFLIGSGAFEEMSQSWAFNSQYARLWDVWGIEGMPLQFLTQMTGQEGD